MDDNEMNLPDNEDEDDQSDEPPQNKNHHICFAIFSFCLGMLTIFYGIFLQQKNCGVKYLSLFLLGIVQVATQFVRLLPHGFMVSRMKLIYLIIGVYTLILSIVSYNFIDIVNQQIFCNKQICHPQFDTNEYFLYLQQTTIDNHIQFRQDCQKFYEKLVFEDQNKDDQLKQILLNAMEMWFLNRNKNSIFIRKLFIIEENFSLCSLYTISIASLFYGLVALFQACKLRFYIDEDNLEVQTHQNQIKVQDYNGLTSGNENINTTQQKYITMRTETEIIQKYGNNILTVDQQNNTNQKLFGQQLELQDLDDKIYNNNLIRHDLQQQEGPTLFQHIDGRYNQNEHILQIDDELLQMQNNNSSQQQNFINSEYQNLKSNDAVLNIDDMSEKIFSQKQQMQELTNDQDAMNLSFGQKFESNRSNYNSDNNNNNLNPKLKNYLP